MVSHWKMARSRQYPVKIMTHLHYADDQILLSNTPAKANSQLPSLEQTAGGIVPYVKAKNV